MRLSVVNTKESCKMEQNVTAEEENHCAAVQTRAMKFENKRRQTAETIEGYNYTWTRCRTRAAHRAAENRSDTEEILGTGWECSGEWKGAIFHKERNLIQKVHWQT